MEQPEGFTEYIKCLMQKQAKTQFGSVSVWNMNLGDWVGFSGNMLDWARTVSYIIRQKGGHMARGKGSYCPVCGTLKFHRTRGIYNCNTCGARGWWDKPIMPGRGKGSICNSCGRKTVRNIYSMKGVFVNHCFGCGVTFIPNVEKWRNPNDHETRINLQNPS